MFWVSYHTKTLRVDRTAAEKKHVAKSNPPQAENPAVQDSFLCKRKNVARSSPLQAENPAVQDSLHEEKAE